MQGQGGQPFFAADDLGDFHQVVVHDVGQVVGGQFVRPFPQHLVVEGAGMDFHMAANHVVHLDDAVGGHLEAYGPVRRLFQQAGAFPGRQGQGVTQFFAGGVVVDEGLSLRFHFSAQGGEFLGAVKGVVGVPVAYQLLGILPVDGFALALPVRGVGMTPGRDAHDLTVLIHAFVGPDAAPGERLDDIGFGARNETVGVGIFDAEDEIAAALFGEQVIVQGGSHAAHMQGPGR